MGSYVWSWLAKIAVSTMTSMITPPIAPSGFFRQNRTSTVPTLGCARSGGAVRATCTSAGIGDTRIEDAVQHVHEEIRDDDDGRDDHDQVLHDRVIAPEDRLHEEAREARQVEHRLRHHQAADEERELDADHGDDGQDGVLQRMVPDHDAPALPLGPRRADVVLAEYLEQRRARDPHDERRRAIADGERGQEELDQVQRKILAWPHVRDGRDPSEPRDQPET